MTPTGSEQSAKTREKTAHSGDVPPYVPPSGAIIHDSDVAELLEIWQRLDDAGRADLLAVARGMERRRATICAMNDRRTAIESRQAEVSPESDFDALAAIGDHSTKTAGANDE